MAITAKDGHGTTIGFGTSGFAAKLIGVVGPGVERTAIDVTTMDTTNAMEYLEAALYDGGEVTLTLQFLGTDDPPYDQPTETITIDWAGAGGTWAFPGFMTGYTPSAAINERMTTDVTIKVAGEITIS